MAEDGCSPIWELIEGEPARNVSPEELPIPEELRTELWAWAERWDATLDPTDPAASGFATPEDAAAFEVEGQRLGSALRAALGPGVEVVVHRSRAP